MFAFIVIVIFGSGRNDNVNGTKSGTENEIRKKVKKVEWIGMINTNVIYKSQAMEISPFILLSMSN